jgi:hypothetical protein
LWASSLVGRRSYRNTNAVLNDVILLGRLVGLPLIATDGFEYCSGVIARLMGPACVYGQVIKTRRNDRITRVDRRLKIGTATRLKDALLESEDSETLNTSFVERLNLTIRQGSAYLRRRSPCHARCADHLRGQVELLRCHYNFVRPHSALKFGRETRTPAMQAGLVTKRLSFRGIFTARGFSLRVFVAVVYVSLADHVTKSDTVDPPMFSWPPDQRTAA